MSNLQPLWTYFSTLKAAAIAQLNLESNYLARNVKFITFGGYDESSTGFIISPSGGVFTFNSQFGDIFQNFWVNPTTAAPGDYQARIINFTGNALDNPGSSPINSWINITSSPQWYLTQQGTGSKYCQFTIQLGRNNTAVVSASVTLESAVTSNPSDSLEP